MVAALSLMQFSFGISRILKEKIWCMCGMIFLYSWCKYLC